MLHHILTTKSILNRGGIMGSNVLKKEEDVINHPSHYTKNKLECIDAIEGLNLPFHEAQILKYTVRWRYKNGLEDLRKAQWYLDRLIKINEGINK